MADEMAGDRVKVLVKCKDMNRGLVKHRDSDRDNMFHTDREGRRQMVCSLLGGHGGAQLVTGEPSLSRRSLARRGGAQPYRWLPARNRGHDLESQYLVGMRCALSGAPLISLIRDILGSPEPLPLPARYPAGPSTQPESSACWSAAVADFPHQQRHPSAIPL
ncbi:hypothetical protein Syun_023549 [Stephania yunnanensis]|uniref:Uncharacterized protein n=1 Tax=Stephania yunnanensis TaxID=152371 RepID=A0AAP0FH68_9MAGN